VLVAHLSDLHLRDAGDVTWLERQLDHIVARRPAHLAITGDILERWSPALLTRTLDALASRDLLHADRLTLLHGNHDFAASGGHPRTRSDLWRLALRFWDPPPIVDRRRGRFHSMVRDRATDVAPAAPFLKTLSGGGRVAVIDTVPVPWRPFDYSHGSITVHHAVGCVREHETRWLAQQAGADPLILLLHHYPLVSPPYCWIPDTGTLGARWNTALGRVVREVCVPVEIPPQQRQLLWSAAKEAGVRLVLCGHLHRARLEWHDGIAVGLNGQSGAAWAGRTIAFYEITDRDVRMELLSA